jgi:outer membrane protein OmpA-like peptidoglycan-associated protein
MEGHRPIGETSAGRAVEMVSWSAPDQRRLIGEDAPNWLAASFAALGTLMAIVSTTAWMSQSPQITAPHPDAAAIQTKEQDRLTQDSVIAAPPPSARAPENDAAEPRRRQADSGAPSEPTMCFSAFDIPFTHDSSTPNIKGVEQSIELLLQWMTDHPNAVISIEGHADTIGTEQYNLLLSFSRAKAIASFLGRFGIPEQRITIRAAGASAGKGKARELARRAVIRIEGVANCNGAGGATDLQ